eukprot:TRINITY_DN81133_c0_g1_i1.p1 TRINITY_DN81133_c0_g1~~TRINITY_DN81133_c0_g1_i1.p1  ORF type:complete len:637 (-),score=113.94 TRINITY_DN81133_c0_g1_i1:27-1724(-)
MDTSKDGVIHFEEMLAWLYDKRHHKFIKTFTDPGERVVQAETPSSGSRAGPMLTRVHSAAEPRHKKTAITVDAPVLNRERSSLGVRSNFAMLADQVKAQFSADAIALSRSSSAPIKIFPDQNMDLMLRAVMPGGPASPSKGAEFLKLVREVSRAAVNMEFSHEKEDESARQAFDKGFEWNKSGSANFEHLFFKPQLEIKGDTPGECGICMDSLDLLKFACQHAFCVDCTTGQLAARWPTPRVVFNYLDCALCRQPLVHPLLSEMLSQHRKLQDRVVKISVDKFKEDGLAEDLSKELERDATEKEISEKAQETMAVYMCAECSQPYCGGRVDCAAQQDLKSEDLRCHSCEWATLARENDRRCFLHGHRYAMFKCDSCCAVATWNCTFHHYCERCHNSAFSDKDFPCPGPEECPLGIPHPPNVAANFSVASTKEITFASFVLGCTACLGDFEEQEMQDGRKEAEFGFPQRQWEDFATGAEFLKVAQEGEVRTRLHALGLPLRGNDVECAERLLLHERQIKTPQALLDSVGGKGQVLGERCTALGLRSDGMRLELAERLLSHLFEPCK